MPQRVLTPLPRVLAPLPRGLATPLRVHLCGSAGQRGEGEGAGGASSPSAAAVAAHICMGWCHNALPHYRVH